VPSNPPHVKITNHLAHAALPVRWSSRSHSATTMGSNRSDLPSLMHGSTGRRRPVAWSRTQEGDTESQRATSDTVRSLFSVMSSYSQHAAEPRPTFVVAAVHIKAASAVEFISQQLTFLHNGCAGNHALAGCL